MRDLEQTLARLESTWGPCVVLVECTIPPLGRLPHAQLDLLIAFPDRTAVIEIKEGPRMGPDDLNVNATKAANQIQAQFETVKAHIESSEFSSRAIAPIIWAPQLGYASLTTIMDSFAESGLVHISVAGGNPSLRDTSLRGNAPAYLPQTVEWKLRRVDEVRPRGKGLGELLSRIVENAHHQRYNEPAHKFIHFDDIREFLKDEVAFHPTARLHDASHVNRLRPVLLNQALEALGRLRFIEVVGQQGMGKSWFVKETINALLHRLPRHYEVYDRVMQRKKGLRDVLSSFSYAIGSEEAEQLDVERLFNLLDQQEAVYWVQDYSKSSGPAVMALVDKLSKSREGRAHPPGAAFWIIESMVPAQRAASAKQKYQVSLGPLEDQAIIRILDKHAKGLEGPDISSVLVAAAGNPLRAVLLWTREDSGPLPPADRLDQYEFFLHSLPPEQQQLVLPIAYILSAAPLGATVGLVVSWCRAIRSAGGDAQSNVHGVIEKACRYGLVKLELFGSKRAGVEGTIDALTTAWSQKESQTDALRVLLPGSLDDALAGWISVLDPHFTEHFVARISQERKPEWDLRLRDVLYGDFQHDLSLTGVTFALLMEDFEPFIRSSFRSSSAMVPQAASWLMDREDPSRLDDVSPNYNYFKDWLMWLHRNYYDMISPSPSASEFAFASPDPRDRLQALIFDTVRARGVPHWNGQNHNWEAWSQSATEFWNEGKYDLWAEVIVRQAQALVRPPYNQPAKAWALIRSALKEEHRLSLEAGRPMLYFHALSFLNKTQLWSSFQPTPDEDPRELVLSLSKSMIRAGLAAENIASIASALFFYGRWIELEHRPTTAVELDVYVSMMRFVQRISPARRVQALLTEGSIHRHFCARPAISWEEFADYGDDALDVYHRVLDFSIAAKLHTYVANALSYSGELVLGALRFPWSAEVREWLRDNLLWALGEIEYYLRHLPEDAVTNVGSLDRSLLRDIYKHNILQLLLGAALFQRDTMQELVVEIEGAMSNFLEIVAQHSLPDRRGAYQKIMRDLFRVVSFMNSSAIPPSRRCDVITACAPSMERLLKSVSQGLPSVPRTLAKSDTRKEAYKLLQALTDAGFRAPHYLVRVLLPPMIAA
jgi:hypothetical protein